jgi:hypothetical protein
MKSYSLSKEHADIIMDYLKEDNPDNVFKTNKKWFPYKITELCYFLIITKNNNIITRDFLLKDDVKWYKLPDLILICRKKKISEILKK